MARGYQVCKIYFKIFSIVQSNFLSFLFNFFQNEIKYGLFEWNERYNNSNKCKWTK